MTIHTTPQLTGPIQMSRASFNIPVKPSACPAGFREALIAQLDVHWADASFASVSYTHLDVYKRQPHY